ncbi:hypothetical protein ARMSODRAFT_166322 [Armillaria solidipes]|uniref:Uncharacterized protein n=1 Tax=Armillaria solidipes TaxID=1076256 RepID=A0A2H3BIK8_9AGAR|nr:hypothetical protein ARMSODRAFT_166322 [Armillaria solidipes]
MNLPRNANLCLPASRRCQTFNSGHHHHRLNIVLSNAHHWPERTNLNRLNKYQPVHTTSSKNNLKRVCFKLGSLWVVNAS